MKFSNRKQTISTVLLVLAVGLSAWVASPWHPSISLGAFQRDLNLKLGLDLQGGSHLVYRATIDEEQIENPDEALGGVRDVIERRVNVFGVSEPVIQTNKVGNEYRVIVELAGVFDVEESIRLIGETPQLDFRREVESEGEVPINTDAADPAILGPLFERTELSGRHLSRATVDFDQLSGQPQVNLEFDGEGADLFAQLTRESIGKRIAIYLDDVPISAPVVNSEITAGRAVITGGFTLPEARQLAQRLNAGALPVPIELIGQQTVGPSLGKLSLQQSLLAGVIGLTAVVIWMTLYYRLPGLIASLSLIMYTVLFLAIIKLFPVTLTLAGIAGLIMSIGMALDANVLIFERFRENLRAGRSIAYSLNEGFKEAWSSIWASNISSLISAFVLYGFGTSIVRGFALTFAIGIILSMFTAIVVTRGILTTVLTWQFTHRSWLLGAKAKTV
ncbi:MAG: protein translocase subunit SecD [Candidatus Andersenbacteria bacterium]|nr:protein translocase subunit SecD [Candidatus Andersenbacteria bacterium]MBI3250334.1 protein translocase subunit SecD [Candidatus Andersenbacteria bacterium]